LTSISLDTISPPHGETSGNFCYYRGATLTAENHCSERNNSALVHNLSRETKDPKAVRWLTLLEALVLLYLGIDSIFFDTIAGHDPLTRIERTLAIMLGTLLITLSIGLFVVACTGRPLNAINTHPTTRQLLVHAGGVAMGAFVIGLCLVRTIKHFDGLCFTVMVLFGATLIADLFWTRRQVRSLAASETANKRATQFLWSCIFFSMISLGFGMAVSGFVWFNPDIMRGYSVAFWCAMTVVAIYPMLRDAKRLADAVGPSR
jgi:hypothetical protein